MRRVSVTKDDVASGLVVFEVAELAERLDRLPA
jgi:hypothetical protein